MFLKSSLQSRANNSDGESGEATLEFIAVAVMILIPIAYFIMTVAALQSASFASEAAARESARLIATNPTATDHALRQVDQIFSDYQVSGTHEVSVQCDPEPCARAELVTVEVSTSVQLPLIPDVVASVLNPRVPIISTAQMPINSIELVR